MAAGIFSLGKRQFRMLKNISIGIISVLDVENLEKKNSKRVLSGLENKGLVIRLGGEVIKLTEKGQKLLKLFDWEGVNLERPISWDGQWRLICYDIPEFKKIERGYFQRKLQNLNFKKIQNSLWVYPYECREEIAVFAECLGINKFIIYLNTDHLPQESRFREYYELPPARD